MNDEYHDGATFHSSFRIHHFLVSFVFFVRFVVNSYC
ncbi:hypothetical protein BH18ACI2_BH18ACI2_13840 [soil metagenome]